MHVRRRVDVVQTGLLANGAPIRKIRAGVVRHEGNALPVVDGRGIDQLGEQNGGVRDRERFIQIQALCGERAAHELLVDLGQAAAMPTELEPALVWISKLLIWYYDPYYANDLSKRANRIQFRGSKGEVREWLIENIIRR